jgi:hypothetical protein
MNPWSSYEHKPQLLEAVLVAGAAIVMLRRGGLRATRISIAAVGALAWGAVGLLDWVIYAFGYQLNGWTRVDTDAINAKLEWVRVPVLAVSVAAILIVGHAVARRDD